MESSDITTFVDARLITEVVMEAIGGCLINVKGCTINCSIKIVTALLEYFKHICTAYRRLNFSWHEISRSSRENLPWCKHSREYHSLQQGRRKQLESGEAKHGVISISIQEVLCSYLANSC